MPTREFDPHDPFDLVGMPVPVEEGHDNVEEMARCFIEEYLNMGWNDRAILAMFRKPTYKGPYSVYRQRGEEYVRQLIVQAQETHDKLMQRLFGSSVREEV